MRLRLQGVPEEDQHVDVACRDHGTDLQIPAQRAALQALHLQPELVVEERPSRPRRSDAGRSGAVGCSRPIR